MALEQIKRNNHNELLALESKYNSKYDEDFQTTVIYSSAWTSKERFETEANTGKKTTGVYVPNGNGIAAYCIYRYYKDGVNILKLEGDDAGCYEIMKYLEQRVSEQARKEIIMNSDERRTDQHQRLSALGFRATEVLRNYFDDNAAYHFEMVVD